MKAGPVEVEFEQELAEVRNELSRSPELSTRPEPKPEMSLTKEFGRLAEIAPRAAVLEAFTWIEERLRVQLSGSFDVKEHATARSMAILAQTLGLISEETLKAIEGLSALRNLAAHSPNDTIGVERARDYLALADAVLYALRANPG